MSASWRPQTRLVHGGINRSPHGETSEALFLTSGFCYERAEDAEARFAETQEGYTYSRVGNPTVRMLEERMALLEGSEDCAATASGMAAVHAALMCQLRAGMRVVGSALLFGSCHWILTQLCPRFGIEVELVDGKDLAAWERALGRPADLVFLETPGNPTLELVDLAAVGELAHRAGAKVIVDNVFATPLLQQPARARRRHRRLLGHQAHRRPGPLPRRPDLLRRRVPQDRAASLPAQHRPGPQPVQRLGAAQGAGDPAAARARA